MNNSKITWFIQDDDNNFIASKNYTANDSYSPGEYLIKNIQIWNNYNGNEDIDTIEDGQIVIAFKNYEDNFLLNLIQISVNNEDYKNLNIEIDRGYINIGRLTGYSNVGQDDSSNCKNIKLKIGPIPENIKSSVKSMMFYLKYSK